MYVPKSVYSLGDLGDYRDHISSYSFHLILIRSQFRTGRTVNIVASDLMPSYSDAEGAMIRFSFETLCRWIGSPSESFNEIPMSCHYRVIKIITHKANFHCGYPHRLLLLFHGGTASWKHVPTALHLR